MSPALNESSTLERFERSNASEIRNGIIFDSYPGLPHTLDIRHNTNYCNIWRQTVDAKELTEGFVLDSVNVVPLTVMTRVN